VGGWLAKAAVVDMSCGKWDELRRRKVDWIDLEVAVVFVFAAKSTHASTRVCRINRRACSELACVK
jgi:hypothetical protein